MNYKHRSVSKADALKALMRGKIVYCKHIDVYPYFRLGNPNSEYPVTYRGDYPNGWFGSRDYTHLLNFLSFDDGYSVASDPESISIKNKINDLKDKRSVFESLRRDSIINEVERAILQKSIDIVDSKINGLEEDLRALNEIVEE